MLALTVGMLGGDGADQCVEILFEAASACAGRVYVLADGFDEATDFLVGVDLALCDGFEGLLDFEPTVFDTIQAFFSGHLVDLSLAHIPGEALRSVRAGTADAFEN